MTLRGPAHPDTFRVQVGRYGDRFYCDPLPGCDIAPATDDNWPSVSVVKKAWPKNLGPWMAQEAARFAVEHRDTWVNLPEDAAVEMIAKASDRTRNKAADRGTGVHHILEMIAAGVEPHEELVPDVAPYLPVLRQLVADLEPEWVYSEVVCINRTVGYGGTADAAIRVNAGPLVGTFAVDWKSRKPGRHDAHRDECAQLAAYARAEYVIVERDGQAVRMAPPHVDGGLIVSITPEDYRLYPVDLDAAWETFVDLREFHDTTKRTIRGKHVVIPRRAVGAAQPGGGDVPPCVPVATAARVEWARERLLAVIAINSDAPVAWPDGVPSFRVARETGHAFTDDELDLIVAALVEAEAAVGAAFPDDDPGRADALPAAPEFDVDGDGNDAPEPRVLVAADDPRVAEMAQRVNALPPDLLAEFDVEAVKVRKLPKFHRGHGTEAALAEAVAILEPLEAVASDRRRRTDLALSLLQANGVEPITALRLVSERDAHRLCEWEAETLDDLALAVAGGVVVVDGPSLAARDGAETVLVNRVGDVTGSKTAGRRELLALARTLAARRQLPPPRSCDDVLASPLLVAAVVHAEDVSAA